MKTKLKSSSKRQAPSSGHLVDRKVSKHSAWGDRAWFLDSPAKGLHKTHCSVVWDFEMPSGRAFTDVQYAAQLADFRFFAWSLQKAPQEGRPMNAQTLHRHSFAWRPFLRWMERNEYESLAEITNAASWEFLADYVERIEGDGKELCASTVRTTVSFLQLLWQQKALMEREGFSSLPEQPLDGLSGSAIARRLQAKLEERVQPVPDDVALPILAAAHRMIGSPADDVIALARAYFEMRHTDRSVNVHSRFIRARKLLRSWTFSVTAEGRPWTTIKRVQEQRSYDTTEGAVLRRMNSGRMFAQLIDDVRDACMHVIQCEAGVRLGELATFDGSYNTATQLPACIDVRTSHSGLNELFFLRGTTYKSRKEPVETEWLIGMRPKGTTFAPSPVRAVAVLQKLYEPWRECDGAPSAVKESLTLAFGPLGFRPFGDPGLAVKPALTYAIRNGQREFIVRYVQLSHLPDVSDRGEDLRPYRESQGTVVAPKQWRKNFAQYLWRVDSRMTPAISLQFKHLSLAMTEDAYIGNDPTLLADINSVRTQKTVELFRAWSKNEQASTGHFSLRLRKHQVEIAQIVQGMSEGDVDEAVRNYVISNDLRIWFSDHGHCFIGLDPLGSKCHEKGGTSAWSNQSPNFAYREPSVCSGCPLYYVDIDHRDFWRARKNQNEAIIIAAKSAAEMPPRVAVARVTQARSVLRRIDVESGDC